MRGCPWNYCTFCAAYKELSRKHCIRSVAEVKDDIDEVKAILEHRRQHGYPADPHTAFLADSNALIIKTDALLEIIRYLYQTFPSLQRLTSYARAKTVLTKSEEDLRRLQEAGLNRLHLGLESGDDEVLERVRKGASAQEMIEAGRKVKSAGFELSEYVMPGLGGKTAWREHAAGSARVLNDVDPHFIRMRTLMLVPGTPLFDEFTRGEFEPLTRREILDEIRAFVADLQVTSRLCFDHFANPHIFRMEWDGYKLPEEKTTVLETIDQALA
jgi:radical SAM superfamily enzyme YgiQ (UPF0313 family)